MFAIVFSEIFVLTCTCMIIFSHHMVWIVIGKYNRSFSSRRSWYWISITLFCSKSSPPLFPIYLLILHRKFSMWPNWNIMKEVDMFWFLVLGGACVSYGWCNVKIKTTTKKLMKCKGFHGVLFLMSLWWVPLVCLNRKCTSKFIGASQFYVLYNSSAPINLHNRHINIVVHCFI